MTTPRLPERTCLLNPIVSDEDEPQWNINEIIRWTDVFFLRMKQLETIHHWLTAYFQAVGFMLQIPGAAEYRCVHHDSDDDLWDFVWNVDTAVTLNLLAAALQRLDAAHLLPQRPAGEDFTRSDLKSQSRRARRAARRNPRWRFRLGSAPALHFALLISDFLFPTSYFRLLTSDFLLPTSYFRLLTSDFLLLTSYF
jgi:hypothetical protein